MSFSESIIIPLDTYKQRCSQKPRDQSSDILMQPSIAADKKLKLYNQMFLKNKRAKKTRTDSPETEIAARLKGDFLLHNFSEKVRPVVSAILDIIRRNPNEINWTSDLEVRLNNSTIPNTNILDILLYFTKHSPITRANDVPNGSREVYEKLISLGMPSSWIERKPPQERAPRKRKAKKTRGKAVEQYSSTKTWQPY